MKPSEKIALLRRHVDNVNQSEFIWGVNDCTRWAADWAETVLGRSLNLPQYSSEVEARAMIKKAGSLDALWTDTLSGSGVTEAYEPEFGNVAIYDHPKFGHIGVICGHNHRAFVRITNGVSAISPRDYVRIWLL
jgi:hypothetical protein